MQKKSNNLFVTTNQFQLKNNFQHEKKGGTYLFDQAAPVGGDLRSKGPTLFWSRKYNLYRSPYLHSCVSGSNCQSASCSHRPSVIIQSVSAARQDNMAALVRSSSWVNNQVPPKGTPAFVYGGFFSVSSQLWRSALINANVSAALSMEVED